MKRTILSPLYSKHQEMAKTIFSYKSLFPVRKNSVKCKKAPVKYVTGVRSDISLIERKIFQRKTLTQVQLFSHFACKILLQTNQNPYRLDIVAQVMSG